jgi:hypothetical protein
MGSRLLRVPKSGSAGRNLRESQLRNSKAQRTAEEPGRTGNGGSTLSRILATSGQNSRQAGARPNRAAVTLQLPPLEAVSQSYFRAGR